MSEKGMQILQSRKLVCNDNADFSIALASTGVDTTLWHHRLGHMSEKGMQILQ